jgi:hypothetical protein
MRLVLRKLRRGARRSAGLANVLIGCVLICSVQEPLAAQRTTMTFAGPLDIARTNAKGDFDLDVVLLDRLLRDFRLQESERAQIVDSLVTLIGKAPVTLRQVSDALQLGTAISPAAADVISKLILKRTKNSQASFLSALTASGNTDRLYSSVDVVRFSRPAPWGVFEARIVTGVSVSNADSSEAATLASQALEADYRTRTADLLTALREGGPIALLLAYNFRPAKTYATQGVTAALALSAAQGGKRPVDTNGRATAGATLELKGFLKDDVINPTLLMATLRGGLRYAGDGIMLGIDKKMLGFGQLTVEFKPPVSTVPIGVAFTWVNKPFSRYSRTVQFFGIAGF